LLRRTLTENIGQTLLWTNAAKQNVRFRRTAAVLAGLLLVLSLDSSLLLAGTTTASDGALLSKIPSGILAYLSARPGPSGCLRGTVTPFAISSLACNTNGTLPQVTYYPDCSGAGKNGCQVGTLDTPSNNFAGFAGYTTVPSNLPTVTYSSSASVSYWIGLQSCVSSCSSSVYLLQAGMLYGGSSGYNSQQPVMFEEFYGTSSGCSSFCGSTATVSPEIPCISR